MKKQSTKMSNITFNDHIAPLNPLELSKVRGSGEHYNSSIERICRFFQKLIYGN